MNRHLELYRFLFARPAFERLNRQLVLMGLKGLGVLNYQNSVVSGERHFLNHLLAGKQQPVCLDVGANQGDYAQLVIDACADAELHCFEPHPTTFGRLKSRFAGRETTRLQNSGCGSAPGELQLFDYANEDGSSHASLHRGVIERLRGQATVSHRVPVMRVDDYLEANNIETVALLKIDTEGHELAVLKGAQESIRSKRIRCIHLEFNEMNAISHVHFLDIFDLLSDYRLYRLLPHGMLEIKQYSALFCEIFAFQNIVGFLREPGKT